MGDLLHTIELTVELAKTAFQWILIVHCLVAISAFTERDTTMKLVVKRGLTLTLALMPA